MSETTLLAMGEVCRRSGLKPSAIRYYEERALLSSVCRVGGKRRFAPEVLDRLAVIELSTSSGFSLDETKVLIDAMSGTESVATLRQLAAAKLPAVRAEIARLELMAQILSAGLQCSCPSLVICSQAARQLREQKD